MRFEAVVCVRGCRFVRQSFSVNASSTEELLYSICLKLDMYFSVLFDRYLAHRITYQAELTIDIWVGLSEVNVFSREEPSTHYVLSMSKQGTSADIRLAGRGYTEIGCEGRHDTYHPKHHGFFLGCLTSTVKSSTCSSNHCCSRLGHAHSTSFNPAGDIHS